MEFKVVQRENGKFVMKLIDENGNSAGFGDVEYDTEAELLAAGAKTADEVNGSIDEAEMNASESAQEPEKGEDSDVNAPLE